MKKYIKPVACIVELQANENIAANPLAKATFEGTGTTTLTTVYDLALFGSKSQPQGV